MLNLERSIVDDSDFAFISSYENRLMPQPQRSLNVVEQLQQSRGNMWNVQVYPLPGHLDLHNTMRARRTNLRPGSEVGPSVS